jgi:hypothetical protein
LHPGFLLPEMLSDAYAVLQSRPKGHTGEQEFFVSRVASLPLSRNLKGMEVHFQEVELSQIATHAGTDPERLVKDAACDCFRKRPAFAPPCRKGSCRPTVAI